MLVGFTVSSDGSADGGGAAQKLGIPAWDVGCFECVCVALNCGVSPLYQVQ